MPLLLALGTGAFVGGGTVFVASSAASRLATLALAGGAIYYIYKKA
ncbi:MULTISPECIES: hypothetical protein [unclassified Sulfurimonas]|nr:MULTISPECIES: hypothetical protein [unclassified Sulfurimonas]